MPEYIPALASADPQDFGFALAMVHGEVHGIGDWRRPFSVQSVSKLFSLALVVARDGPEVWRRVGREPSGDPFNSLVQLEHGQGASLEGLALENDPGPPLAPRGNPGVRA